MPRKKLIISDRFPYHVTARTNNKELFPRELSLIWEVATQELHLLSVLYEIEIHAFVLMPNHFHLILTVPSHNLGKIMSCFLSSLTRKVNSASCKTGHLFGGPYFWSLITSTRYFGHVLKYVYRNPVKAKLSETVEAYEFSTLRGLMGETHLPLPVHYTRIGLELNIPDYDEFQNWLSWLNRPFPAEAEKLIAKCLRKKVIKELLLRSSRTPDPALASLL